jgi:hypothetical protein
MTLLAMLVAYLLGVLSLLFLEVAEVTSFVDSLQNLFS